jgi:hypothetical protein
MGNPWSIGAKDARLFVPLLLDGSLPVSQLKREVDKVLSAAVYRWLPPSKGVNAKGLSSISTALRDLSLLRFLSKRKIDDALGGPLLKGFDDTTAYDRVAAALEIFRGLFPGLGCDARVCGQTIEDIFPGYAAYKKAHPRFGR